MTTSAASFVTRTIRFGPWLVSSERLFRAIDSVDSSSGKKRGLLLLE